MMGSQFVWPYYYPQQQQQQQQHPYFQYTPTSTDFGSGYQSPRSWHGSPNISPAVLPTFLPVPVAPPVAAPVYQPTLLHPDYSPARRRSNSIGASSFVPVQPVATAATPWPTVPAPYFTYAPGWTGTAPMGLPRPQLHNLINGDIIAPHLHLNFFEADLVFKKRNGSTIHPLSSLSSYDLEQPATHPHITHVRIVCDMIPQWPVDLQVLGTSVSPHRRRRAALPYLTLEDVVHAVHASLHRKISHHDWGRMSTSQQTDVASAYTHRFKSAGSEWSARQQQVEGVKRVDFLLKNTWFKGFTWLDPENGVERLRLLVGFES